MVDLHGYLGELTSNIVNLYDPPDEIDEICSQTEKKTGREAVT